MSPRILNSYLWLLWVFIWLVSAFFTNKTKSAESFRLRIQYQLPIVLGYLLIIHSRTHSFFLGPLTTNPNLLYIGDPITLLGLLFSLWARLHLGKYWSGIITVKQDHKLIRTGPYRIVRHPIYTGMTLAILGTAQTFATPDAYLGALLIIIGFILKLRREESLMTQTFGDQYTQFKKETPALIPFIY